MSKTSKIIQTFEENINLHRAISNNTLIIQQIDEICEKIIFAIKSGGKVMICGNGGSASDAQHMAAEFVGRFEIEREGLPAVDLTSSAATMTALANDYSFEKVFSRQVESIGKSGDMLIGISTSGNSGNVAEAFRCAHKHDIITIGLLGRDGGVLKNLSDIPLIVPYAITARIQEVHATIIHIICGIVEKHFAEDENAK